LSGTLSGVGPNKTGITDAKVKDLGFTGMTENASLNVRAPGGTANRVVEELDGPIITSNDTAIEPMPEGTVTSGGANG